MNSALARLLNFAIATSLLQSCAKPLYSTGSPSTSPSSFDSLFESKETRYKRESMERDRLEREARLRQEEIDRLEAKNRELSRGRVSSLGRQASSRDLNANQDDEFLRNMVPGDRAYNPPRTEYGRQLMQACSNSGMGSRVEEIAALKSLKRDGSSNVTPSEVQQSSKKLCECVAGRLEERSQNLTPNQKRVLLLAVGGQSLGYDEQWAIRKDQLRQLTYLSVGMLSVEEYNYCTTGKEGQYFGETQNR